MVLTETCINIFSSENFFWKRRREMKSLNGSAICEINSVLRIPELWAFSIEYIKVIFATIKYRCQTNV